VFGRDEEALRAVGQGERRVRGQFVEQAWRWELGLEINDLVEVVFGHVVVGIGVAGEVEFIYQLPCGFGSFRPEAGD